MSEEPIFTYEAYHKRITERLREAYEYRMSWEDYLSITQEDNQNTNAIFRGQRAFNREEYNQQVYIQTHVLLLLIIRMSFSH